MIGEGPADGKCVPHGGRRRLGCGRSVRGAPGQELAGGGKRGAALIRPNAIFQVAGNWENRMIDTATGSPLPKLKEESGELRRGALGVGFITFFVVSAAGPLVAIAGGVPVAMLLGNGAGIPAAFFAVLVVLMIFSVGYTSMARYVTNAGAFYAFTTRGLGGIAGGAAAIIAIVAYNTIQIGIYGMFGAACSGLLGSLFGVNLPWWLYSYAAMTVIAVLGYRQIDLSAKVLGALVVGEYLGVLILDMAIVRLGGASGISAASFTPHAFTSGSPSIGLLFCFAAFIGFEATTIYAEEAKNPERTVPLATYFSVLLIGGFYTLSTWCLVTGIGADQVVSTIRALSDPTHLLFKLSDHYVGGWLTTLLRILFVTSVFAALLAFHNSVARYFYAMGRDGLLPSPLGRTHAVHQSPHIGSILQTLLAAAVVSIFAVSGSDPVLTLFSWLTNVGTLGVIVLMALVSFAVPAFFLRNPTLAYGTVSILAPVVAGIAFVVTGILAFIHFDVLTGASRMLAVSLPALILLAALIGAALALRLRRADPARFAHLGLHKL
jgi:amino acid transporter